MAVRNEILEVKEGIEVDGEASILDSAGSGFSTDYENHALLNARKIIVAFYNADDTNGADFQIEGLIDIGAGTKQWVALTNHTFTDYGNLTEEGKFVVLDGGYSGIRLRAKKNAGAGAAASDVDASLSVQNGY